MDWQDNEFEGFLKRFRLREPRPLTIAQDVRRVRSHRRKIAAAAVLMVAIGASAAIVRQYAVKPETLKQEPPIVGPIEVPLPLPPVPETSSKPDPRPPEPLKQLTKVIPAAETQDAGPLSNPKPTFDDIIQVEEDPGRRLFFEACVSCHDADLTATSRFESRDEYAALVERMVGRGASVSEQQLPLVVDYLFRTYGTRKALVTSTCTGCHGMDVVESLKGDNREAYRAMVDKMISFGASIPADQVGPLVDYLFRTYGSRSVTP
jgi:cytochrome c553